MLDRGYLVSEGGRSGTRMSSNIAVADGDGESEGRQFRGDLLRVLREAAPADGVAPTADEFDELDVPFSSAEYIDRYDSWHDACLFAGVEPPYDDRSGRHSGGRHSDEDLLEELQRVGEIVGRPPSTLDFVEHGRMSPTTVGKRFGSWYDALEEAGFSTETRSEGPEPQGRRRATDETLLRRLREFAVEIGHAPSTTEFDKEGPHAPTTLRNRWGSWGDVLERAGLGETGDPVDESILDEPLDLDES